MSKKALAMCMALLAAMCGAYGAGRLDLPVEKTPFDDKALAGALWDASARSTVDEGLRWHVQIAPDGFVTEYIDASAEHYLMRGDSMIFRGYTRGHKLGALVDDTCATALRFPLVVADSVTTVYSLRGDLEGVERFRERGMLRAGALRRGRFVFAPGDTLDAVMVRENRSYTTFVAPDSVGHPSSDEFVRWYAVGCEIPFAVQLMRRDDRTPRLFVGDWNEASELAAEAAEGRGMRQGNYGGYYDDGADGNPGTADEAARRGVLEGASIVHGTGELTVTLGQLPGIEAEVYIVDVPGNIYGRSVKALDAPSTAFTVPTSSLSAGRYMIVIIVGGEPQLIEKRYINL